MSHGLPEVGLNNTVTIYKTNYINNNLFIIFIYNKNKYTYIFLFDMQYW